MIVNVLASGQPGVARTTVRRWLAEDIERGAVERVTPGFYRLRQRGDAGSQQRGRPGRLAHPERTGMRGQRPAIGWEYGQVAETCGSEQCGTWFVPRREHARFCRPGCRVDRGHVGDLDTGASAALARSSREARARIWTGRGRSGARDREWGKSGADELVSGGPEQESGCPSVSKESLIDRGDRVFCCLGSLVVVLDVARSNSRNPTASTVPWQTRSAGCPILGAEWERRSSVRRSQTR
jgi:hypothetical protein